MKLATVDPAARRRLGRPLSFNRDEALRHAMLAFWEHGYETTSVNDLTAAMGITAPSLYTAFGDKKRLFLEAVQLYSGDMAAAAQAIDAAPTAFAAARDMLVAAVVAFTGEATPPGCLLASAAATGSAGAADVRRAVADVRTRIMGMLHDRIARGIAQGECTHGAGAETLSRLVIALIQGLSTLARDGLPRAALLSIVDAALHAWPPPLGDVGGA